jgi:NAD(P)-dependent dehydrogenase (short-subunit alcohol dehydrogenase family)
MKRAETEEPNPDLAFPRVFPDPYKSRLPAMRRAKWGRIINMASGAVTLGRPGYLHYITSKSALVGMSKPGHVTENLGVTAFQPLAPAGPIRQLRLRRGLYITPGGCSWLHGVVQIRKKAADDGKKAIEAAFNGHKSMKHVVIVDDDVDTLNYLRLIIKSRSISINRSEEW